MNKYCIYSHINKINGKRYIGLTKNFKKRWGGCGNSYKKCPAIYSAFQKYGWDNFHHIILVDNLEKQQAIELEKYYICLYKTKDKKFGYNLTDGGDGTKGHIVTEEYRNKLSKALLGKYKGRHFSQKSEFKKGHTFTKETLEKMSKAKLGKPSWNKGLKGCNAGEINPMKIPEVREKFIGTNNGRAKSINQYDLENNFIKKWDYISDVCKQYPNIAITNIIKCAKHKIKSSYGFKWEYA